MYHPETDTPALCRTSSLVEELGQIEYIFSDKTGTLTCNQMQFRQCSIAGIPYSDVVDESKQGELFTYAQMRANLTEGHESATIIDEFLTLLACCHTVIPEVKDEKITYQASSPDEAALVAGAEVLGYRFTVSASCCCCTPTELIALVDAQAPVNLRRRSGPGQRVPGSQHSRVQQHTQAHVEHHPGA